MNTYTFHAHGMHCKACKLLIEGRLKNAEGITSVLVDEKHHTVMVTADSTLSPEELAAKLTTLIAKEGYSLKTEKQEHSVNWNDFYLALPIALAFVLLFVLLQKMGIVNLIQADTVTYPVALLIGLVASVSTCLAVVGGLLLSVSANYAKSEKNIQPQVMFHVGRLISFFVLGGVIGMIGSAFTLSAGVSVALSIGIGVVMLILGLNLLDIHPSMRKLQLHMPSFFTKQASKVHGKQHAFGPLLIGASTFFLPCGFTQTMQIYTLSTGSFLTGAFTMTAFALGTLPVLALISFTSFELGKGKWSGVFFKSAGLLVVAFAMINIINGLAVLGIIKPIIGF